MSDKIQKFLAKLTKSELERVIAVMVRIEGGLVDDLNMKPIKGKKGFYRVRVERVRIIYRLTEKGNEIVHVTNRNEKTYRDF
jgi:mRNA-degrading endonuclease RelE of RelBE toxin-antitoxin system